MTWNEWNQWNLICFQSILMMDRLNELEIIVLTNKLWLNSILFAAGHPSPFGPFSLLQAPWLDPAYLNLAQLTGFGQFGSSLGSISVLPSGPKPWDHSAMRRDPLALIKGQLFNQIGRNNPWKSLKFLEMLENPSKWCGISVEIVSPSS